MNLNTFINSALLQASQQATLSARRSLVSTVFDKASGQYLPQIRLRWNGPQGKSLVTLTGFGIRPYLMLAWGTEAAAILKARVRRGIGSDDAPMPRLKERTVTRWKDGVVVFEKRDSWYEKRKARMGLQPIRDLWGFGKTGGHMLDDVRPSRADERSVTIDITRGTSRMKARANEKRAPWWGLSPRDTALTMAAGARIFEENLDNIAVSFGARPTRRINTARPIWMDPIGFKQAGKRAA